MATWLHDSEIFAALAAEGPGLARDWATTRLALFAPDRYTTFPDDSRCHDVLMAAGPERLVQSLIDALGRGPVQAAVANAAAGVGQYGLIPEDPSPLAKAMAAALRNDGDDADLWLAYGLSVLGKADRAALAAAARARGSDVRWVLPIVLLRVAESAGALDEAAAQVARQLEASNGNDPQRVLGILAAMGVPLDAFARRMDDVDQAIRVGAAMAHQPPSSRKLPQGGQRRRHQAAVGVLLEGVPGPTAALLRAVYRYDPHPSWHLWLLAIASWVEARSRGAEQHGDWLHDVLHHGAATDPFVLSKARRDIRYTDKGALIDAMNHRPDLAAGVLVAEIVGQTHDAPLADSLLALHGGDPDADVRSLALACFGATNVPDRVPALLQSPDPADRLLGLVVAEWVPSAEVLAALLAMPIPVRADVRKQLAWSLAAMADAATIPHLEALKKQDGDALADPLRLAEALLHAPIA
jgi:hypothetical protein